MHIAGILKQQPLADALHAMDVFAFASTSETQGMVLTEAMAAGLPVVALDAAGAREVVADGQNGRLLLDATSEAFSAALEWVAGLPPELLRDLKRSARATAEAFSMRRSADKALACFEALKLKADIDTRKDENGWEDILTFMKTEWDILKSLAKASDAALGTHLFSDREAG